MRLFLKTRAQLAAGTILLTLLILVAAASPTFLAADETTDKVDKLFAAWDKTTTPGAALAVITDG